MRLVLNACGAALRVAMLATAAGMKPVSVEYVEELRSPKGKWVQVTLRRTAWHALERLLRKAAVASRGARLLTLLGIALACGCVGYDRRRGGLQWPCSVPAWCYDPYGTPEEMERRKAEQDARFADAVVGAPTSGPGSSEEAQLEPGRIDLRRLPADIRESGLLADDGMRYLSPIAAIYDPEGRFPRGGGWSEAEVHPELGPLPAGWWRRSPPFWIAFERRSSP